ncbi:MAG: hydrolase [Ilumatobacteraceae bacterium]|nr:hydrolase [Ilumatobacteraceae bacterium]
MPTFTARDGTLLAYHVSGDGSPIVCLPGGPMQDSAYLGDLGGLSAHRRLVMFDLRGTGRSAAPDDVTSYRCDRLVDDVEDLRSHLGLEQLDLLAHSAGANLAVLYAAAHADRIARLALITPSTRAVGIDITGQMRLDTVRGRTAEPWFPEAFAALERTTAGRGTEADWGSIAPFTYGRWDAAAQAHHAAEATQQNGDAAAAFGADGVFAPDLTRATLASLDAPVLLVAGGVDVAAPPIVMAEFSRLFPHATLQIQPGAGHFPWLDDPHQFVATVAAFF